MVILVDTNIILDVITNGNLLQRYKKNVQKKSEQNLLSQEMQETMGIPLSKQ